MNTIIALGGEPATGKSTLTKKLLKCFDVPKTTAEPYQKILRFHQKENLYFFGVYDDDAQVFSGTDRLAMNVQPIAVEFIKNLKNSVVFFEGDRLFSNSFLEVCADNADLKIIFLKANHDVLAQRHVDRNDSQPEQFLKAKRTKLNNISQNMMLADCMQEFTNETPEQQKETIIHIIGLINAGLAAAK